MENNTTQVYGSKTNGSTEEASYDLVVFCHLRWDFVYQRPQHLISRLAKNLKILFVEEPIGYADGGQNTANLRKVTENLHVLQPKCDSIESIWKVMRNTISQVEFSAGWFYSASFVSMLDYFSFDRIVYDCMDELTMFKGAPEQLLIQEKFLIANADVIFTGGKSLYESKKELHENVYCFPSSVDRVHFEKATNGIAIPDDIANIPGPIAGYFGVIDERLDLELIDKTAAMNPTISFVMIGPLAKIGEHDLPRRENIHYLGMKSYAELPGYLKAFSVATMPFALNDATKFISPTKTLEYMAAGKPIISTAIKDVVRDYSHCVPIVSSAEEFTAALEDILQNSDVVKRRIQYNEILEKTSWDATAAKMNVLITNEVNS